MSTSSICFRTCGCVVVYLLWLRRAASRKHRVHSLFRLWMCRSKTSGSSALLVCAACAVCYMCLPYEPVYHRARFLFIILLFAWGWFFRLVWGGGFGRVRGIDGLNVWSGEWRVGRAGGSVETYFICPLAGRGACLWERRC